MFRENSNVWLKSKQKPLSRLLWHSINENMWGEWVLSSTFFFFSFCSSYFLLLRWLNFLLSEQGTGVLFCASPAPISLSTVSWASPDLLIGPFQNRHGFFPLKSNPASSNVQKASKKKLNPLPSQRAVSFCLFNRVRMNAPLF